MRRLTVKQERAIATAAAVGGALLTAIQQPATSHEDVDMVIGRARELAKDPRMHELVDLVDKALMWWPAP